MLGKIFLLFAGCVTLASAAPTSSPEITNDPKNYNDMEALTFKAYIDIEEPITQADSSSVVKLSSEDSQDSDGEDSHEDHETENNEYDMDTDDGADSDEDSDEIELTTSSDFTKIELTPYADFANETVTSTNMHLNLHTYEVPLDKESNAYIFEEEATEASGGPVFPNESHTTELEAHLV